MQVLNGEEWTEISYSTMVFTKLPRFRLFMLTSDLVYNNISFCERTAKGEMTVSRIGKTRTKPWINNWHNYPACGMHSRPRRIYPSIQAITETLTKQKWMKQGIRFLYHWTDTCCYWEWGGKTLRRKNKRWSICKLIKHNLHTPTPNCSHEITKWSGHSTQDQNFQLGLSQIVFYCLIFTIDRDDKSKIKIRQSTLRLRMYHQLFIKPPNCGFENGIILSMRSDNFLMRI